MNLLDEKESAFNTDRLAKNLPEQDIHDLEFTIAVSREENTDSKSAPMLEALTNYRDEKLN